MVSTWKWFLEIFWSEKVWLPPGVKWRDIENGPGKKVMYPDSDHFLYLIPMVVIILFIRYTLVKTCYEPLGRAIGVKNKMHRRPQRIPLLESAYRQSPRIIYATNLAKKLNIKERQVEQWWRRRRNADKPSRLTKFCEYAWKATYTSANTLIGLYVLWDKDFFWDLDKCVIGYPHQGVNNDLWWFYTINSSITSASIVTALFFEVRRKDFTVLLVHHVLQITLRSVAWISGWFRIAAITGPLMDSADSVMEVVKACKLAKYDTASHIIFAFFCLLWTYTRLYIYPFHILYGAIVTAFPFMHIVGVIADSMLIVMFLLQLYWSMMILRVCYNYFVFGASRDVRSSSSEVSDSELADKSDKEGDNSDTITCLMVLPVSFVELAFISQYIVSYLWFSYMYNSTVEATLRLMCYIGIFASVLLTAVLLLQLYWSMWLVWICNGYFTTKNQRDARHLTSRISRPEIPNRINKQNLNTDSVTIYDIY